MRFAATIVALALALVPLHRAGAQEAAPQARVTTRLDTWHDAKRDRDVEVKLYIPIAPPAAKEAPEAAPRLPVVIFSHGLGGSREGYRYLGEHLASRGYLVIFPTHEGSDGKAVRERLRPRAKRKSRETPAQGFLAESTSDPENLRGRPADISFVIDHLAGDAALHADLGRIAVAGHSFGAYTTLAIAGMTVDLPGEPSHSFRDPRVKAAIAMSPQGSGAMGVRPGAWDPIDTPVLLLTGTKDYGQGERAAAWRREPFDAIKKAGANHHTWLMVITDATHMTFATSGNRPLRRNTDDEAGPHQQLVLRAVDGFLDAHLRDTPAAMDWLTQAASSRRDDCTVETTAAVPAPPPPKEPAPAGK